MKINTTNILERFYNSEIKIEVDNIKDVDLMRYIFKKCDFNLIENKYTFEKGRFFWVENGLFGNNKQLHNSMNLIRRNRCKKTIKLSELNVFNKTKNE